MIYYCIISALLNSVTGLLLGVAVLLRRRAGTPHVPLFLFLIFGSVWSGSYAAWLLSNSEPAAWFWIRALSTGAILIPAGYFHFCLRLVGISSRIWVSTVYLITAVFAALSWSPWMVARLAPLAGFPFWPRAGILYYPYVLLFGAVTISGWVILYREMRRSTHSRRNQIKFAWASTFLGFVGGATNFPYWFDLPVPPIGNGLVALYLGGVAYTLVGLRLLDVNYVAIKLAAYLIAAVPLALVFPGIWFVIHSSVDDFEGSLLAFYLTSFVISLLGLVLIPMLKRRVDQMLEQTMLRSYLSARDRLRDLAYEIAGLRDEEALCTKTSGVVAEALDTQVAIYMRGELDSKYVLRAAARIENPELLPNEMEDGDCMISVVRDARRAVITDEDPKGSAAREALVEAGRERHVAVVVPVHADDHFYGILLLGWRRRNRVYSSLDLAMLESLCLQVGLHVRARQVERRVNQAEKLISLGTLAAGLAHELRNPLVSIKTFSQLLGENANDADFQREFSSTVLRDVGRIESIVENVAAFATDRKVPFSWIRLEEVVRAGYAIVKPSFESAGVRYVIEHDELPHVRGNHNQLTQIVINLLNNAVQAFKGQPDPCVTVRIRHRVTESSKAALEMTVRDNGSGVDPEILPRLFEPFTTTKDHGDRERKAGMGLGLAIVKRIVDGHSGVIRVETEKGRGTTFTVVLPCEGEIE